MGGDSEVQDMAWIKILIACVGNPLACLAMMFVGVPGTFISMGGNTGRLSIKGWLILIFFGFIYILALAGIRRMAQIDKTMFDCIEKVTTTLLIISSIGLILPVLLAQGMEWNVFGFLIFLPSLVFSFIYFFFSIFACFKRMET